MKRPDCPYDLGEAGHRWWVWAWSTPQADRWDAGSLFTVARRAQLEDDRRAAVMADDEDLLANLLQGAAPEAIESVRYALGRLSASAASSTALSREMRELETQLGLGPKAWAGLGGKAAEPPKERSGLDDLAQRRASRRSGAPGA